MPEEEVSLPNTEAGGEAMDGGTPPVDAGAATAKEGREKWFIEMRGWVMLLAVQVASFTYQAGINPPSRFFERKGSDDAGSTESLGYNVFFYSNTTAFLTSLAIIILLMNRSFYDSLPKVTVLVIIMLLDLIGLMAAYWAGSTRKNQNSKLAGIVLTVVVLFVIYVAYTVQLVQKLYAVPLVRKLFAVVRRRIPVPARVAARDDDEGTLPTVSNQQNIGDTRAPPPPVIGRPKSDLRRHDSRLGLRTPGTGKSTRLSP